MNINEAINLTRPLVFFDLETTGVNIMKDRIIEICGIKVFPDGREKQMYLKRFNPGFRMGPEVIAVHGITNEMLEDEPTFQSCVQEIVEFFSDCDLGGYNIIRFDVPLLVEEILRCGVSTIPFQDAKYVDCMTVWHKMEARTLANAAKYFTGESLVNAHSAKADTEATVKIFEGQLAKYGSLGDVKSIHDMSMNGVEQIDYDGKFKRNKQGELIFTFGTNKDKKVADNHGMLNWMLDKDFTEHTKLTARKILSGELV